MRMLLKVSIPIEVGNEAIKKGILQKTVMNFVESRKPEATHFVADQGLRTMYAVFDLHNPADIPSIAEPFFLHLNAEVLLTPAMNLEDMKAGVEKAMKQS